jgi:dTDP-4-amino-4,6-dideoxygalactose transaminase
MTKKKNASQGDFRYAVGNAKVPWQAVGEYFKKDDVLEVIRFLLPDTQGSSSYNASFGEVRKAVAKLAAESGTATKLTLGKKVQEAEQFAKDYLKVKHACFLTNWTAGMEIGYKLSGLRPGDEVIMPAITFIATMAYPLMIGAKVVFADIDPKTANLDPADVARKITPRTKVIVPVHIGGCPCDMEPIMALAGKHSIYVMEDAAHGLGGMYKGRALGTIGHFGGYSLHEVKNINSFGEGGILVSNLDCGEQFARGRFLGLDFSKQIKDWLYDITPLTDRFGRPQVPGNHSAMEIQGLGFIRQMKRLDGIIAARKKAAEYMNGVLAEEDGILPEKADTANTYSTHHLYLLRINPKKAGGNIQALKKKLTEKGLTCITHFGPMYRFNIMKQFGYDENKIAETCPVTEDMFHNCYTHLPLYPLTRKQLEYQARAVVEAVREMKKGV